MPGRTRRQDLDNLKVAQDTLAAPQVEDREELFRDLCDSLDEGKLIPIIGDTVRNEHIFAIVFDKSPRVDEDSPRADRSGKSGNTERPDEPGIKQDSIHIAGPEAPSSELDLRLCAWNITEQLAVQWARRVGYPMIDSHRIARVAQYVATMKGRFRAKKAYLDFQKQYLLELAKYAATIEDDGGALARAVRLEGQCHRRAFPYIVQELGFPHFSDGMEDPLDILARLRISVFVTTGYYDFVERALRKGGRNPRTQLCLWNRDPLNVEEEHRPDPDFEPDLKNPLVYHLFGLEQYAGSMVLCEEDYMEFLTELERRWEDPNDEAKMFIPSSLQQKLLGSSLLLLGYRLHDWDLRVLLRVLKRLTEPRELERKGVAIQLNPRDQPEIEHQPEDAMKRASRYLSKYFDSENLKVHWDNTDSFVARLWDEWQEWQRGS